MFLAFPKVIGSVLGVLCALLSVGIAGAGHGWVSALPFGLLAIVLYPVSFSRLRRFREGSVLGSCIMLAVALVLDILLFMFSLSEGGGYFLKVLGGAILWLVLWSGWQLAAIATLVLQKSGEKEIDA